MKQPITDNILIVYGSLAPGRPNHYRLRHISGDWFEGYVYGQLEDRGWGAGIGYPGLIVSRELEKQRVSVSILKSEQLPDFWSEIDAFEGDEYQRILIDYETDEGLKGVGNIYVLNKE